MFEKMVIDATLCKSASEKPDTLELLRSQYASADVLKREFTGVGFFTNFVVNDKSLVLSGKENFELGYLGEINDVQYGVGFVLFVREGFISMLEGYTYGESWPCEIEFFNVAP